LGREGEYATCAFDLGGWTPRVTTFHCDEEDGFQVAIQVIPHSVYNQRKSYNFLNVIK